MDCFHSYLFVTILNNLDVIKQFKNVFVQGEKHTLIFIKICTNKNIILIINIEKG